MSESNNKRSKQSDSSLTSCGVFAGSTALDFLIFMESWKSAMRILGVEDMIVHGTDCGKPIQDLLFDTPDRLAIICEVQNDQIEEQKKTYRENYLEMANESPWIAYWWMNQEVPSARRCSPDPITKMRRNYSAPSQIEFETILDLLPLGHDGILGMPRSARSEQYYPDTSDFPPAENPDPHAPLLSITVFNRFSREMADLQIEVLSWNFEEEQASINDGSQTIEGYVGMLTNKSQNRVKSLYISRVKTHKEQVNSLKDRYKVCSTVFNKIGISNLKSVQKELDDFNFHAAFNKLVTIYVNKGIANTEDFEERSKLIFLQPGQSITDHWNCLTEALRRWATVLAYLQDLKNHVEIRGAPAYIPVCDKNEAEANSGFLRDQAIIDLGYTVHISESVRYRILNNSLNKHTNRFQSVMDVMSGLPLKKRFVKNYLDRLKIREDDQAGQDDIAEEINKILKDESSSSKKAMSAAVKKSSTPGKFPPGSCKNHPSSTTHNTKSCKLGVSSSDTTAQKRDFKPCEYCMIHNPKLAAGHPNERCYSNKESPAYKGEKRSSSNVAASSKESGGGKSSKKRKSQGQLSRRDFKSKAGYELFCSNQNQMSDFLKRVTIDGEDDDSSDDK
jgi:hypothetical protein